MKRIRQRGKARSFHLETSFIQISQGGSEEHIAPHTWSHLEANG